MSYREYNFDGLVGPTHNYSGLSFGNVASTKHRAQTSSPRRAALQGLEKMWALHQLGLGQALLPPHERPYLPHLRALGFSGNETEALKNAASTIPDIFRFLCSASPMWTANAATVAPSIDSVDGKVHFTPANLNSKFHRSFEHETTSRSFRAIFSDARYFTHHPALPSGPWLGDEGAANHTRLAPEHGKAGLHLFVFGRYAFRSDSKAPKKFPARQTFEASQSVARLNQVSSRSLFLQQTPELIDAGVFHNDVASVGNEDVFFAHEKSFVGGHAAFRELSRVYRKQTGGKLRLVMVPQRLVSVADAVKSYLFNTQLVTLPSGQMTLIAPSECEEVKTVAKYLHRIAEHSDGAIAKVHFFNLRESMSNGGGPACLRLRVLLNAEEQRASAPGVFLNEASFGKLKAWVERNYREKLAPKDIYDPKLWQESKTALDELTQILGLGSLYSFQR